MFTTLHLVQIPYSHKNGVHMGMRTTKREFETKTISWFGKVTDSVFLYGLRDSNSTCADGQMSDIQL